jgi:hypothetical protein
MSVPQEFIDEVNQRGGVTFKKHTSWSKDRNIAKKFIYDDSVSMYNNKTAGRIPVLFEKTFTAKNIILDIDAFVSFMGITQLELMGFDETNLDSASKEKEILITSGIRITKSNMKIEKI